MIDSKEVLDVEQLKKMSLSQDFYGKEEEASLSCAFNGVLALRQRKAHVHGFTFDEYGVSQKHPRQIVLPCEASCIVAVSNHLCAALCEGQLLVADFDSKDKCTPIGESQWICGDSDDPCLFWSLEEDSQIYQYRDGKRGLSRTLIGKSRYCRRIWVTPKYLICEGNSLYIYNRNEIGKQLKEVARYGKRVLSCDDEFIWSLSWTNENIRKISIDTLHAEDAGMETCFSGSFFLVKNGANLFCAKNRCRFRLEEDAEDIVTYQDMLCAFGKKIQNVKVYRLSFPEGSVLSFEQRTKTVVKKLEELEEGLTILQKEVEGKLSLGQNLFRTLSLGDEHVLNWCETYLTPDGELDIDQPVLLALLLRLTKSDVNEDAKKEYLKRIVRHLDGRNPFVIHAMKRIAIPEQLLVFKLHHQDTFVSQRVKASHNAQKAVFRRKSSRESV